MEDPLAQLRGIHLPPEVSWWPPALGWWLLLVLCVALLALIVWGIIVYQRKKALQKLIQQELDLLLHRYKQHGNFQTYAQELSELLKRGAISLRNDSFVAGLSGQQWQHYIQRFTPAAQHSLCSHFGDNLYQAKGSGDVMQLQDFAHSWLNTKQALSGESNADL